MRIELDVNDFRLESDELLAKIEEILGIRELDFVEEDMGVVYERDANATVGWFRRPLDITPEVYHAYKTLRTYIKAKG